MARHGVKQRMLSCRAMIIFSAARKPNISQEPLPERLFCLSPCVPEACRVLVLGSFPSASSLAAKQYYAHPQNRFWRLVGDCLGVDLRALPYAMRIKKVNAAAIGIWDIYAACERSGSLDSAIRNAAFNDFSKLRRRAPGIRRVCLNGSTAAKAVRHLSGLGFETVVLPSTSPANASQDYAFKLARWRAALERQ